VSSIERVLRPVCANERHLLVDDRTASRCRIGLGVDGYATLRLAGKVLRSMRHYMRYRLQLVVVGVAAVSVPVSTENGLLAEPS
jgi:hypothetical protein